MNERIKELYEQSLIRETGKDHAGNPMLVIKQNPEKFAELIVKECASVCDKLEDEGVYHGVGEEHGTASIASAADCSFYIKEHFGVEE